MSNTPADAQEQFNRHAANYAVSVPHSSGQSLSILTEWASLGRYELGIDLATGPGFTAFAIAEFCETVVASDIAEGMLVQARNIAARLHLQFTVTQEEQQTFYYYLLCRTSVAWL